LHKISRIFGDKRRTKDPLESNSNKIQLKWLSKWQQWIVGRLGWEENGETLAVDE